MQTKTAKKVFKEYTLSLKRKIFDCLVNDFIWNLIPNSIQRNKHITFWRKDLLTRQDINNVKIYFKDLTVKNGIFKGLRYFQEKSFGSAFYPKLVGSYEVEIQTSLKKLLKENIYQNIIDIGCAEGYYLAGVGMINSKAHLYGVDISEEALNLTEQLLLYNGIENRRFTLSKSFDFKVINNQNKNLVIIDCEGHELEFIKNITINDLNNCDFLIECHDFIIPSVTKTLKALLTPTHFLEIIYSGADELKFNRIPQDLVLNNYYEKLRLVNEERPTIMNWIIAESKSI